MFLNQLYIAIVGGALLGSIAGVSTSKTTGFKDKFWRAVAGLFLGIACTNLTCDYLKIVDLDYSKTTGIAFVLGFTGWHILSIATIILDKAKERAQSKGLGAVKDMFDMIRGKKS